MSPGTMANWETSTQRKQWIFDAATLEERRRSVLEASVRLTSLLKTSASLCGVRKRSASEWGRSRTLQLAADNAHSPLGPWCCVLDGRLIVGTAAGGVCDACGTRGRARRSDHPGRGAYAPSWIPPAPRTLETPTLSAPGAPRHPQALVLQRFYEGKIMEVCAALRLPPKVKGAALNFFKRFMLTTGPLELDNKARAAPRAPCLPAAGPGAPSPAQTSCFIIPQAAPSPASRPSGRRRRRPSEPPPSPPPPPSTHNAQLVMLTCVYLACKVEEAYFSAEELGRQFQQSEAQILNTERQLLEALSFHFVTYSPYRSLGGLVAKLADAGGAQGSGRELEARARRVPAPPPRGNAGC